VKPFGESYKPLRGAMVFTCELQLSDEELVNDGADVDYTIQWFDVNNNNAEITDRTGRSILFLFSDILTVVLGLSAIVRSTESLSNQLNGPYTR